MDNSQKVIEAENENYFRKSVNEFKDLRKITFAGIMLALSVALQMFTIPIDATGTLKLQFTFIVSALSGVVLGPFMSLLRGAASDLFGFLIFPSGMFFPGYTLSAALGAAVYSLFFWNREIRFRNILFSKITVNIFVNAMLGSLWNSIMYGKQSYIVYFGFAVSKNLIMLPLEVVVLCIFFRVLLPVFYRNKLISKTKSTDIVINKKTAIITIILFIALAVIFILLFFFGGKLYSFLKSFIKSILA